MSLERKRRLVRPVDGAVVMLLACICLIAILVGTAIAGGTRSGVSASAPTAGVLCMSAEPSDMEAAIAVLEKAVAADPENAEAYLKLGTAQMVLGHSKTASAALEEYRRLR